MLFGTPPPSLPFQLDDRQISKHELTDSVDFIPLIQPGDTAGFAREIARLRDLSPEAREQLGRQCRQLVETDFSLPRMLESYTHVYEELSRPGQKELS